MGKESESRRGGRSGGEPSAHTASPTCASARAPAVGRPEPKCRESSASRGGSCLERTPHAGPRASLVSRLPAVRLTGKPGTAPLLHGPPSFQWRKSFFCPISRKGRARLRGLRQLSIGVLVRQCVGRLATARLLEEKSSAWPPALEALSSFVLFCSRWWPPGQLAASAASLPPGRFAAQVSPGQSS